MRKQIIAIVFLLTMTFAWDSYGQQEAQYTQYMYNTLSINPAYAGSRGVFSFTGLHRSQWVGLEGAPQTQTLNVHAPTSETGKIGLGLSIVNDQIGPTNETNFDIAFSYTIKTSERGNLSFGLKAGGHLLDVAYSQLNAYNPGDVLLQSDIENKFSPNIGAGIYYRNSEKWYVGLSAPNLLETKHFNESSLSVAKERIHYYLMGGYVFDLSSSVKLKPAFLVKAVSGAPLQADLSANFLFNEKLTLGAAYRWSAAFSGLVGFQVTDGLMIGLAYDRETTELGNTQFNDGSYEVFLRFELFKSRDKIISPRFF